MELITNIILNLQAPNYATVYAPETDRIARKVKAQLVSGAQPWEIPEGAAMVIRYMKPDGTWGFYDSIDEVTAYSFSGSTVTFTLATQMLTAPGTVLVQLNFYSADEEKLSTFTWRLEVLPSAVVSDAEILGSEDYFEIMTGTLAQMQGEAEDAHAEYEAYLEELDTIKAQVAAFVGAPRVAATAAAMTDHSLIYVYTGSETGYTNGHWYYWDGTEWADGGAYNSSALTTDPTLSIAGMAADAAACGDVKSALNKAEVTLLTSQMYLRKGYIDGSGLWKSTTSTTVGHRIYPVQPGDVVVVTASPDANASLAALTSDSVPVLNNPAPLSNVPDWTAVVTVASGTIGTFTMPSDAKYIYFNTKQDDTYLPSSVVINGRDILQPIMENVTGALIEALEEALVLNADYNKSVHLISATEENPVDYNDITTPGSYIVQSSAVAAYVTNKPENLTVGHRLIVLYTTNAERIMQIIIANANAIYLYARYYNGTAWSGWTDFINSNYAPLSLAFDRAETITTDENINTYINPGNFRIITNAIAETVTGLPVPLSGRLSVATLTTASSLLQIYITQTDVPDIFVRRGNIVSSVPVWEKWTKVINTDTLIDILGNNFATSYTLKTTDFAVGSLNFNTGNPEPDKTYRVYTPNIQLAIAPIKIVPREGFRFSVYYFVDGVFDHIDAAGINGTTIAPGSTYKIVIRRSTEDTTEVVTVDEFYDKAVFSNPVTAVDAVSITGDVGYVKSDFGVLPTDYYKGIDSVNYAGFNMNTLTAEIYTAFDALVSANPLYITKTDLGLCSDGVQHVYMYDLKPLQKYTGDIINNNMVTVFLLCGQHGYEKASVFSLYYLAKNMIENTEDSPILRYLRNHVRLIMIPIANPYGFDMKQYKNYNGVNLNRNWSEGWEHEPDPTSSQYGGEAPFDQPETAAIRDAFNAVKSSVCLAIDYHTYGQVPNANYGEINDIIVANKMSTLWNQFKKAVQWHIKNNTSVFKEQYSLPVPEDEFCGSTITGVGRPGRAGEWFVAQNTLACTFETFAGFPGETDIFTNNVIRASEELISNFLITVFHYLSI